METDKEHNHYMIETLRSIPCGEPTMFISKDCKSDEKLYDIPYMGKIFELFAKTVLERAYVFHKIFCL